jgi:hypothetical protein
MYKIASENNKQPLESFFSAYGIEKIQTESYGRVSWDIAPQSRYAYRNLQRDRTKWHQIASKPYEVFEAKEVKHANDHYEISLLRLAARLEAKGIKGNFTAVSGRVGLNFEVVINHVDTITRAWTIIAEGPIVRAHYRYLVK